jgi:hypothetical protein
VTENPVGYKFARENRPGRPEGGSFLGGAERVVVLSLSSEETSNSPAEGNQGVKDR